MIHCAQKLINRAAESPLEEDGLISLTKSSEQGRVVHASRTDLDDVGIWSSYSELGRVHHFGHDAEIVAFREVLEDFKSFFTKALK